SRDIPARWPRRDTRLSAVAVHALLGTRRALRNVANRRFHILPCQRLLSRSLSFDAFVVLLVPARGVSLPEVQAARLLQPELYDWARHSRVTFPHIGPRQQTPQVKTAITTSVAGQCAGMSPENV